MRKKERKREGRGEGKTRKRGREEGRKVQRKGGKEKGRGREKESGITNLQQGPLKSEEPTRGPNQEKGLLSSGGQDPCSRYPVPFGHHIVRSR